MSIADHSDVPKKLFFVQSPQHNLESIDKYFQKRGFDIQGEAALEKVFASVQNQNPDFIFVALDHVDPHISEIYRQLIHETNALIVPYITSVLSQDILRLMQVNNPIKLSPPLTGPSIMRFVEQHKKDRQQLKAKQIQMFKPITHPEIQNDGHTILIEPAEETAPSVQSMAEEEEEIQKALITSIVDLTQALPVTEWSEPFAMPLSVLQKKSLDEFCDEHTTTFEPLIAKLNSLEEGTESSMYALLVESIDCSGVFILSSPLTLNEDDIQIPVIELAKVLADIFGKIDKDSPSPYRSQIFKIKSLPKESLPSLREEASFNKEFGTAPKIAAISFYSLKYNPFSRSNRHYPGFIKLDPTLLTANEVINFEVFIELKQNNKLVKFIKEGTLVNDEMVSKLTAAKNVAVYAKESDDYMWYEHSVSAYLSGLIKKP